MTHTQQRLAERNIKIDDANLWKIARHIGNTSAAVLLGHVDYQGTQEGAYRSREDSNGDLVVLIVRDGTPITVMYRRSDQPFTPDALRVKQVYTIGD